MTTILRFILFFLFAPTFAIIAQVAGTVQDDFCIVDTGFRTESIALDNLDGEICHYDSSGALLHKRKSFDGEDGISRYQGLKTLGATEPLFSFLAESVATNKAPIWSATKSKSAVENAFGHYKKHGSEFPEFQNAKQYAEGTRKFLSDSPSGTLTKARPNGDRLLYEPASNTFGVQNANGAPRTMFRPDPAKHGYPTNLDYFNAQ